jgi:hypothetical protein
MHMFYKDRYGVKIQTSKLKSRVIIGGGKTETSPIDSLL